MCATTNMVKLASPVAAVFSKKRVELLVESHPLKVIFWPGQHLGNIASVGAYRNCRGEFTRKNLDFRDKGLNIFDRRHSGRTVVDT